MKHLAIAALLAVGAATASTPFLIGSELQAAARDKCASGCALMSVEDVAALSNALSQALKETALEAYRAGTLSCRNAL